MSDLKTLNLFPSSFFSHGNLQQGKKLTIMPPRCVSRKFIHAKTGARLERCIGDVFVVIFSNFVQLLLFFPSQKPASSSLPIFYFLFFSQLLAHQVLLSRKVSFISSYGANALAIC